MKCCCGRAAVLQPSGRACCVRGKMLSRNEVNALTMRPCCAALVYVQQLCKMQEAFNDAISAVSKSVSQGVPGSVLAMHAYTDCADIRPRAGLPCNNSNATPPASA